MAVRVIKWPGPCQSHPFPWSLCTKEDGREERSLNGRDVLVINSFLEDSEGTVEPKRLRVNENRMTQGSIFLGDGFLLTETEAEEFVTAEPRNVEVICRVINGQEINNRPDQVAGREASSTFVTGLLTSFDLHLSIRAS